MILKVTGLIWSMNAALSRLFGRQTLGAVKKPPEICEFCEAGPQGPPPQRQNSLPEN